MQTTSALYQELLALPHLKTEGSLFSGTTPSVGGAVAGEVSAELLGVASGSVARMAKLQPQVRLVGADGRASEWIAQGVYNVDKRSYNKQTGVLTLHGYDKMLATEQWYTGTDAVDIDIVNRVCTQVGITLDDETAAFFAASGRSYVIPSPTDYTCRELLQTIAGCYGGNWCMTPVGELRLVLLKLTAAETSYLVDGVGSAITFGGDRILVG